MSRLSTVDCARLTQEQQELYDSIAKGPRAAKRRSLVDEKGNLTGPFNAFLHLPEIGKHWSAIGVALRFRTTLDRRLFELAILIVAVHWRSGHEWAAHSGLARAQGLGEEIIAAILGGKPPAFAKADEAAVYAFAHELVTQHRLSEATYAAAVALLGEVQIVELANVLGYYTALAAMLNAFDVHPPKGLEDPWATGQINRRVPL
jgi:4-carboxymuconolactone decarboxylase